MAVKCS